MEEVIAWVSTDEYSLRVRTFGLCSCGLLAEVSESGRRGVWSCGWFGMIRCANLKCLCFLVAAAMAAGSWLLWTFKRCCSVVAGLVGVSLVKVIFAHRLWTQGLNVSVAPSKPHCFEFFNLIFESFFFEFQFLNEVR